MTIFIVVLTLSGCYSKEEGSKNKSNENTQKDDTIRNDLVNKYDAIVFDDKKFIFSKDITDISNRNLLLSGSVNDIYEKDGKYFMKIDDGHTYYGIFEVNSNQTDYIKSKADADEFFSILNDFLVVVKIDNVFRPAFRIDADNGTEGAAVQLDTYSSDFFMLHGNAIEIIEAI